MSTYLDRSLVHRPRVERPARAIRHPDGGSPLILVAWGELWKRTVGGSFERLPDPTKHPECWFRLI